MKAIEKHPVIIIILLYILANFFMLLNNGWYWDDWCISSPEGLRELAFGTGTPYMIQIHSFLMNLTSYPTLLYHITTGIIEILGIIIFYKCLSLLKVEKSQTFLLTLFFTLLPYNLAKISIICYMYSIGFLFFLLAILFFISFTLKKSLILRVFSLILFFCSFMVLPSTLVFALAFFLFMAIPNQNIKFKIEIAYFKTILFKLISWFDFILIPFIFWIFRLLFLKPTGIYAAEGYREFTLTSVFLTPINLIFSFIQNVFGLGIVSYPLSLSKYFVLLFIIVFIILFLIIRKRSIVLLANSNRILNIGLFFFIAGAFAYTMIGLFPSFGGYDSRHQILLRIGSSILLLYFISKFRTELSQKIVISTIISLFIVFTINTQLQFQSSWFKQIALEKAFKNEKLLAEGVNFIVVDNTKEYNEFNEDYAFYCYTGILTKSFGTQTRFAIDSKNFKRIFTNLNPNEIIERANYNMKGCKNISSFNFIVIINPGKLLLTNFQNITMLYQYYFDKIKFDNSLNNILSLQTLPFID